MFLDCFVEWLVRADAEGEDELFTVRTGRSIATLRRKEVNVVIKEVAVANGLPAKNFSSKSLRGGFSTQCDREGVSRGVSNVRGMWAQGSRVQEGHYLSQVGGEGVGAGGRKEGIRTPFPAGTCKWGAVNRVTRLVGYPGTFTGD